MDPVLGAHHPELVGGLDRVGVRLHRVGDPRRRSTVVHAGFVVAVAARLFQLLLLLPLPDKLDHVEKLVDPHVGQADFGSGPVLAGHRLHGEPRLPQRQKRRRVVAPGMPSPPARRRVDVVNVKRKLEVCSRSVTMVAGIAEPHQLLPAVPGVVPNVVVRREAPGRDFRA
jgi:hypothetical protein